jgi:hypothetical protein
MRTDIPITNRDQSRSPVGRGCPSRFREQHEMPVTLQVSSVVQASGVRQEDRTPENVGARNLLVCFVKRYWT